MSAATEVPWAESVRLRDAVDDSDMPMDILVAPEAQFNRLRDMPGLIYREICQHGGVAYGQPDLAIHLPF